MLSREWRGLADARNSTLIDTARAILLFFGVCFWSLLFNHSLLLYCCFVAFRFASAC